MDAAPDEFRTSASATERLEAVPAGAADLDPISPELALIDPDLARQARELLPEPREWPTPRATSAPQPAVDEPRPAPPPEPELEPARRRRWAWTLVVAALIFAAGAGSGRIVAPRPAASPGATLEVRAAPPAMLRQPQRLALDRRTTHSRKKVSPGRRPHRRASASRLHRRYGRVVWASNVLGVVTRLSPQGVVLFWRRPAGSARVVVLRSGDRRRSRVVYRGRGTHYEDSTIRSCMTYRYTLVSYDRRGHRSTGVSSSVVTPGCT
jgi:hypothetical protein